MKEQSSPIVNRGDSVSGGNRRLEKHPRLLGFDRDRVTGEERLLTEGKERIRDVRQGPDGALYVLTDGPAARLFKLVPRR